MTELTEDEQRLIAMNAHQCGLTRDPHTGWVDGLAVPMNFPPQGPEDYHTVAHLDLEDSQYGPLLWDYAITMLKARVAAQENPDA